MSLHTLVGLLETLHSVIIDVVFLCLKQVFCGPHIQLGVHNLK